MIRSMLICSLLLCLYATNDVGIVDFQTNLTAGDTTTANPVTSVSYTADGNMLVASAGQYLSFFSKQSTGFFLASWKVHLGQSIMQATFKPDGTRLAAISTNSNTLYILSSGNSTFTISQSINLGSPPNSITWSVNGERLIAGLRNGTVEVFGLNTTNQYDQVQLLGTSHKSIAYIAGVKSRFVTCGTLDQSVNIFYYNTTTKQYSLNQTVSGLPGDGCSAIDYSPLENRIAVGRTNGLASLLLRDANYIYSISNNISAHPASINFVKWSGDSVYLLTAGSTDSTVKLWTGANNFTGSTSSKTMKGQSATYSTINEKFAIGTFDDKAGTIAIEMLKATNCANATVASNPSVCNCNSGQIWQNGNCSILNCTGLINSPQTANTSTSCNCNAGFTYSTGLMACQRDCSGGATPNSNGTNYEYSSCFCLAGFQWQYSLSNCYIICSGMTGSSGASVDSTTCTCNTGYNWNTSSNVCYLNCTGAINSNNVNANATSCACIAGYAWNSASTACWVNCANMAGSNGSNINSSVCACNTNFIWTSTSLICSINCNSAANSPGTSASSTSCNCNSGFSWNSTLSSCAVNCSGLTNSNNTNNGTTACYCSSGYTYVSGVCSINCAGLANSPGTNLNATWCNCNSGYIFRPNWLGKNFSVCQLDCSKYPRTDASRTPIFFEYQSCQCVLGYTWTSNGCVLNCTAMRYSNKKIKNSTACQCLKNYRWDYILGQCVAVDNNTSEQVGLAVGLTLGILALIGIAIAAYCYCKKKKAKADVPAVSTEAPPTSAAVVPTSEVLMPNSQTNYQPSSSRVGMPGDSYGRVSQQGYTTVKPPAYLAENEPVASKIPQYLSGSRTVGGTANTIPNQDYNQVRYQASRPEQPVPQYSLNNPRASQARDPYLGNQYQFTGGPRDSQVDETSARVGPQFN